MRSRLSCVDRPHSAAVAAPMDRQLTRMRPMKPPLQLLESTRQKNCDAEVALASAPTVPDDDGRDSALCSPQHDTDRVCPLQRGKLRQRRPSEASNEVSAGRDRRRWAASHGDLRNGVEEIGLAEAAAAAVPGYDVWRVGLDNDDARGEAAPRERYPRLWSGALL